jgi:hypothetical protein
MKSRIFGMIESLFSHSVNSALNFVVVQNRLQAQTFPEIQAVCLKISFREGAANSEPLQ